jgi:hypothetical protein
MRTLTLVIFGASLLAASIAATGAAAERRNASKAVDASASNRLRNANDSAGWPAQPGWNSGHSEGISAPAGR